MARESKDGSILKRNLLALTSTDPTLSARISRVTPAPEVSFSQSKSGQLIPSVTVAERIIPLHSTFDPVNEGRRFAATYSEGGFLVFLGLGAGYHIRPFLGMKRFSSLIVVEKKLSFLRAVIERIDLTDIFLDPRLKLVVDEEPDSIKTIVLQTYFPAIAGNFRTIPLRSQYNLERAFFQQVIETVEKAVSEIADDYTVQAHFGKMWFINTLANLASAEKSTCILQPVKKVIVTGAGPSLELQIQQLKAIRKDSFLLASDTSLPSLLSYDIVPDIVISIDCQHISYHHFLQGFPQGIPLVLDLASPPTLTRVTDKIVFFSSGHPFSLYASRNWRKFPIIDTSGGNVSHAGLSLANALGAKEIHLFGMDFAYPKGKSYARGTYIYHFFRALESRFHPLESQFFSFIQRNKAIVKDKVQANILYTSQPLLSYKQRMEHAIKRIDARVIQYRGHGIELRIDNAVSENKVASGEAFSETALFSAGPSKSSWRRFLETYRKDISQLPDPYEPLGSYFHDLSNHQRDLWITQFPAAIALRESYGTDKPTGLLLLNMTRRWTVERIQNVMKQDD